VTGLVVVVAVLALATAFGVWRARRDGRLRPVAGAPLPPPASPPASGPLPAAPPTASQPASGPSGVSPSAPGADPSTPSASPTASGPSAASPSASGADPLTPTAGSAGEVRAGGPLPTAAGPAAIEVGPDRGPVDGTLAGLGVDAATPVTLLQFSSAFCAPCRATRRVLGEVADMVDGVRHVEVDAESHLDAVRALDIWRTPTTLVVAGGQVVQRASGVPAKAQVVAAVAPLVEAARVSEAADRAA